MASTQLGDVVCRSLTVNGPVTSNDDQSVTGNFEISGTLTVGANLNVMGVGSFDGDVGFSGTVGFSDTVAFLDRDGVQGFLRQVEYDISVGPAIVVPQTPITTGGASGPYTGGPGFYVLGAGDPGNFVLSLADGTNLAAGTTARFIADDELTSVTFQRSGGNTLIQAGADTTASAYSQASVPRMPLAGRVDWTWDGVQDWVLTYTNCRSWAFA
jgi:hypothetical protein